MDKEAQGKIDIVIFNAIADGKRKKASSVEAYRIAIITILEGEGYHKLPKDKPLLLSDEEMAEALNKFYERVIYSAKSVMPSDRAIAQAQREADIKFYGGSNNG